MFALPAVMFDVSCGACDGVQDYILVVYGEVCGGVAPPAAVRVRCGEGEVW